MSYMNRLGMDNMVCEINKPLLKKYNCLFAVRIVIDEF